MSFITKSSLILTGIIHILPAVGVLGQRRVERLYDVRLTDPNLTILMRHRAVLFGQLGVFLITAAFRPTWHAAALMSAATSVTSFLFLCCTTVPSSSSALNDKIKRVVKADILAAGILLCGSIAHIAQQ